MEEVIRYELEHFYNERSRTKREMESATGLDLINCRQRMIMIREIIEIKEERLREVLNIKENKAK